MPIIDAHIHAYPPEVFSDPLRWGSAHREPWWTYCVVPPHQPTLQGWATTGQLLRDMDAAGIDQVVMLGWYWQNQATCDLQNRWFIDWHRAHPDRIQAFACVRPSAGAAACESLERALDAGLCGIGELLPQAQGGHLNDENWGRVFSIAAARGVPVNLHVTDPLGITPEACVKATPLEPFIEMIKHHSATPFILAHWGGGIPFHELNPRLRPLFKNVYYDTAASALLYDPAVYRHVVSMIGPERILFGTDYPLLTHPTRTRVPEFARDLAEARASGLSPAELDLILGGNAARLLRLKA